jgi:hypothetical protein
LDTKKAYDRLEWDYLQKIMIKLGFHMLWVQMIMRMINSVSFLDLFNGHKLESFKPTRGIRQGDPISPYLFLLAAEGLSCLLKSRIQSSNLMCIKVAPSAPIVRHLLFADESWLLFKADRENAEEVTSILNLYCSASRQRMNLDKSSIHFAKGCIAVARNEIKETLDVHKEALSEKYLGMPTNVATSMNNTFTYHKDRV